MSVQASSQPVVGSFMSVGESVCWPFIARPAGKLLCTATARVLPQYSTQPAKTTAISNLDFISWDRVWGGDLDSRPHSSTAKYEVRVPLH